MSPLETTLPLLVFADYFSTVPLCVWRIQIYFGRAQRLHTRFLSHGASGNVCHCTHGIFISGPSCSFQHLWLRPFRQRPGQKGSYIAGKFIAWLKQTFCADKQNDGNTAAICWANLVSLRRNISMILMPRTIRADTLSIPTLVLYKLHERHTPTSNAWRVPVKLHHDILFKQSWGDLRNPNRRRHAVWILMVVSA